MFKNNKDLLKEADGIIKDSTTATSNALKAVKELNDMAEMDELLNDEDRKMLDKGLKDINMLMEYRKQKLN